jgi:hypothetical protein
MSRRNLEHARPRARRKIPPESTGLPPNPAQHDQGQPAVPAWVSDELLRKTQAVWSAVYGREVSAAEAVEILVNVKALAEVVLDVDR